MGDRCVLKGRIQRIERILLLRRFVTCSIYDQEPRTVTYGEVMRMIERGSGSDDDGPCRVSLVRLGQGRSKARQIEQDLSEL
jgi:hypothetical protein